MEGQFTAKVSGAVPWALFAVITTHFIFVRAGRGGAQHSGEAEASTGSQSDDVY